MTRDYGFGGPEGGLKRGQKCLPQICHFLWKSYFHGHFKTACQKSRDCLNFLALQAIDCKGKTKWCDRHGKRKQLRQERWISKWCFRDAGTTPVIKELFGINNLQKIRAKKGGFQWHIKKLDLVPNYLKYMKMSYSDVGILFVAVCKCLIRKGAFQNKNADCVTVLTFGNFGFVTVTTRTVKKSTPSGGTFLQPRDGGLLDTRCDYGH
jgi:hypothetical protein